MIPIIVLASLKIGSLFFQSNFSQIEITNFDAIGLHLKEYLVGSFILASASAFVVGFASYILMVVVAKKRNE